jgi:hypothetical protein
MDTNTFVIDIKEAEKAIKNQKEILKKSLQQKKSIKDEVKNTLAQLEILKKLTIKANSSISFIVEEFNIPAGTTNKNGKKYTLGQRRERAEKIKSLKAARRHLIETKADYNIELRMLQSNNPEKGKVGIFLIIGDKKKIATDKSNPLYGIYQVQTKTYKSDKDNTMTTKDIYILDTKAVEEKLA